MSFTFQEAREEVLGYLKLQEESYFMEHETTEEAVLANSDLIDEVAFEHLHCVNSFGCDPNWSLKDACDNDPGIWMGLCSAERELATRVDDQEESA